MDLERFCDGMAGTDGSALKFFVIETYILNCTSRQNAEWFKVLAIKRRVGCFRIGDKPQAALEAWSLETLFKSRVRSQMLFSI